MYLELLIFLQVFRFFALVVCVTPDFQISSILGGGSGRLRLLLSSPIRVSSSREHRITRIELRQVLRARCSRPGVHHLLRLVQGGGSVVDPVWLRHGVRLRHGWNIRNATGGKLFQM